MIRRLQMALAIAQHRSFNRAAKALGVSQPTLTRALQVLEGEMGARLFERGKHECTATPFGDVVIDHARRILREVSEGKRKIALLQGLETGSFSVGTGRGGVQHWIASAIGDICFTHPALKVRTSEYYYYELADALMSAEIDVAVGDASGLDAYPHIVLSRLPRRRVAVVCRPGHPLTKVGRIGVDDLRQFRLVGPPMPRRVLMQFPRECPLGSTSSDGRHFVPAILCSGWYAIREIVGRSDAIAFRPVPALNDASTLAPLEMLPFEAPWLATEFAIMWRRDRMQHPALKAFRDACRISELRLAERKPTRLCAAE